MFHIFFHIENWCRQGKNLNMRFFSNELEYKLVVVEIRAEQRERERESYETPNIVGVMLSVDLNRTGL